MSKRPEIIKRKRSQTTEPTQVPEESKIFDSFGVIKESQSLDEVSSSTPLLDLLDQSLESVEVPKPPERLEKIEPTPPTSVNTFSAWQPELREIALEHEMDVWESFLYD